MVAGNKKQLIVVWGIGILLCLIFIFSPRAYYIRGEKTTYEMAKANRALATTEIDWDKAIQYCIPIILIGSLLTYTLRNKKG